VSITYITPSKVSEVSAILVATMHFLNGLLSNILAYSSDLNCEYIGKISIIGTFSNFWSFSKISVQVTSISSYPVINIRISPGPC